MNCLALLRVGAFGLAVIAGCESSNPGPVSTGPEDGGNAVDSHVEGAAAPDAAADSHLDGAAAADATAGDASSGDGSVDAAARDASAREASSSASGVQATTYSVSFLNLSPGLCFPPSLPVEATGLVSCQMFYELALGDACAAHPGLSPAAPEVIASLSAYLQLGSMAQPVCVLTQLPASQWVNGSCATSSQPGWCYVAGAAASPCAQGLVLSPSAAPPAGASALLGCATPRPTGPFSGASNASAVGTACTPSPETSATFPGFDRNTVALDQNNPACGSDVCLVNHFRGRTTCAYGQDAKGNSPPGVPACTVPGTNTPVQPQGQALAEAGAPGNAVEAQCVDRRPSDAVYCSCRCANAAGKTDDGAAYCSCPSGYGCTQVVPLLQSGDPRAGGYCVLNGTAYSASTGCISCDSFSRDCP